MVFISKKERRETWFFYLFLLTLLKKDLFLCILLCVGLLFKPSIVGHFNGLSWTQTIGGPN